MEGTIINNESQGNESLFNDGAVAPQEGMLEGLAALQATGVLDNLTEAERNEYESAFQELAGTSNKVDSANPDTTNSPPADKSTNSASDPAKPKDDKAGSESLVDDDDDTDNDLPEFLKRSKTGNENNIAIKDLESGQKVIAEKFNIDLTKPEGYQELTAKMQELTANAETSAKVVEQYNLVMQQIQALPAPMKAALNALAEGQDYKTAFERASGKVLDFNADITTIPDEKLIEAFGDGIITKDEFLDEPESPESIKALQLCKAEFKQKQNEYRATMKAEEAKRKDAETRIISSIDTSNNYLLKNAPNPDSKEVKELAAMIKEQGLAPIFQNQDGTLREDASLRALYAVHGNAIISAYEKQIQKLKDSNRALRDQVGEVVNGTKKAEKSNPADVARTVKNDFETLSKAEQDAMALISSQS